MNKEQLLEARKLIAGFLKNRREELGISAATLAEACQVNKTTIYRIEDGKFTPNTELLFCMLFYLKSNFTISKNKSHS